MKKKIIILFSMVFILSIIFLSNNIVFKRLNEKNGYTKIKHERNISMMLETGVGTGVYETTTRESWPTDGYIFNPELSKCENGSKLSWDNTNNKVIMTGSTSDKCYVYFDVLPYTITYPNIGSSSIGYATFSGPTEGNAGETISVSIENMYIDCNSMPIISIPSNITDFTCTTNIDPNGWVHLKTKK